MDRRVATRGLALRGHHFDRCRLPCAIVSEEGEALVALHGKADTLDRMEGQGLARGPETAEDQQQGVNSRLARSEGNTEQHHG